MNVQPFKKCSKLFALNFQVPEGIKLTVNQGGTSSGKTWSILQVLLLIAYKHPRSITTVAGQDMPNLKTGSIRDILNIINDSDFMKWFVQSYNKSEQIFTMRNGSIIEFKSYDDEQDAKNGKRDFLFCNEANGLSYGVFEQLYVRTKQHTWIDYNPSAEFWLHEHDVLDREDVRFIKSTFLHNPFLDQSIVDKILSYKETNPYRWKVYGLGEMCALEGAIFKNWKIGEFNGALPFVWGMDFGYSTDPTTLVKVAKTKRKIFLKEELYQPGLSTRELEKFIRKTIDTGSDTIIADCAEPRLIDELFDVGIPIHRCTKGKDSVRNVITQMQDYEIIIDPGSKNMKKEAGNYVWHPKISNTPVDKHNHLWDAARYAFDELENRAEFFVG